jgi:UDP-3-O-[3-hydroxymyristoyl] glucosamine N-acyltransferase
VTEVLNQFIGQIDFKSLVHPSANVAKSAEIKSGVVLLPGAHLGPDTIVEEHCFLGVNSSLDHDSTMKQFSSLAPGAMTGGAVCIGLRSALLIQSSISHGQHMGNDSVLAGGSFLKDSVGDLEVWGGLPARMLKTRQIDQPYL